MNYSFFCQFACSKGSIPLLLMHNSRIKDTKDMPAMCAWAGDRASKLRWLESQHLHLLRPSPIPSGHQKWSPKVVAHAGKNRTWPARIAERKCSQNARAKPSQRRGGYSFNLAVLNAPSGPTPIATSLGFVAFGMARLRRMRRSFGILHARSPVGFTASAPNSNCLM